MADFITRFEQVPISVAKAVGRKEMRPQLYSTRCALCGDPVSLEDCKTDENGAAVHDACYIAEMAG
jgi:hypothetical protein